MPKKYRIGYINPISHKIEEVFYNGNTVYENVDNEAYKIWKNWHQGIDVVVDEYVKNKEWGEWRRRNLYPDMSKSRW
jgi:hypothetical protein